MLVHDFLWNFWDSSVSLFFLHLSAALASEICSAGWLHLQLALPQQLLHAEVPTSWYPPTGYNLLIWLFISFILFLLSFFYLFLHFFCISFMHILFLEVLRSRVCNCFFVIMKVCFVFSPRFYACFSAKYQMLIFCILCCCCQMMFHFIHDVPSSQLSQKYAIFVSLGGLHTCNIAI